MNGPFTGKTALGCVPVVETWSFLPAGDRHEGGSTESCEIVTATRSALPASCRMDGHVTEADTGSRYLAFSLRSKKTSARIVDSSRNPSTIHIPDRWLPVLSASHPVT